MFLSPPWCPLSLSFAYLSLLKLRQPPEGPLPAAHTWLTSAAQSSLPVPSRHGFSCLLEFHRCLTPDILKSKLWIFSPKLHLPDCAIFGSAICTRPGALASNLELAPDLAVPSKPLTCLPWTAGAPGGLPVVGEPLTV